MNTRIRRQAVIVLLASFGLILLALFLFRCLGGDGCPTPLARVELTSTVTPTPRPTITPRPTSTRPGLTLEPTWTPAEPGITIATLPPTPANEFFVAPNGSPEGDGSQQRPWDLQTALNHPTVVQPGSTIWLRDGLYSGPYTSHLKGAPDLPIVVRQYPGERAILDGEGPMLTIQDTEWTWFWGFEITKAQNIRPLSERPNAEAGITTDNDFASHNVKFINLILHDLPGAGISWWRGNSDSELYGCIIYYNGVNKLDHGIYTQNRVGEKRLTDNIIFSNASHGIHIYGSEDAFLNNFVVTGNTVFNNGFTGLDDTGAVGQIEGRNILVGGNVMTNDPVVSDNYTYYPFAIGTSLNVGYNAGSSNAVITGNYLVNGDFRVPEPHQGFRLEGNFILAQFIDGVSPAVAPDNTWAGKPPAANAIFVRPNQYEPGRANITIYNWELQDVVQIPAADLSGVDLQPGDRYQLRNVQDYFADVIEGVYDGQSLSIPMTGRSVAQPNGLNYLPPTTFPEFGAFVLFNLDAEP